MASRELMSGVDLMAALSGTLADARSTGAVASVREAAGLIAGHVDAEAATVWDLTDRDQSATYRWTSLAGAPSAEPPSLADLERADRRWRDRLAAGEILDLPSASCRVLPLRVGSQLVGALALVGADLPGADIGAAVDMLAVGLVLTQALDRARSAAAHARAMLDDVGAVIVRLGGDGRLMFVNEAWTTLTGIAYDDIIGRDAMHHVHPDDRVLAAQHMAALIEGSTEPREVRFLSHDGSVRWMEVTGQALFDDAGAVAGFAGILHDVTERRGAELEAHEARTRAEHAQEVAERANRAKSDFLSRMSHELRTPLNAIIGFSELLEGSPDLPPEDSDSVAQISAAGRHLLDLVSEALDVTRIETGQMPLRIEPVPVAHLTAQCLALMRAAAAENGLTLHGVPVEHARIPVLADEQRLRQVMLNLLSNAVKYSRPGGQVHVDCYRLELETPAGRHAADGWVRITVTDSGLGIPADRLDDVFMPFERIGAERTDIPGTGLGLALSRGLVEAMRGVIGVHSVPGVGTTFRVDLPAAPPGEPADRTAPAGDRP